MKEKQEIKMEINEREFLRILSLHYSELLGKEIEVKANISVLGNTISPSNLDLYFENEYNVGQSKVKVTTSLSKTEVEEIISSMIDKLGYDIESLKYQLEMEDEYDCIGRYEGKSPSFNGITLKLRQKGMKKVLN